MGFFDRLSDIAGGFMEGGIAQTAGMAWDLAQAPFVDDDYDGILGTLNAVSTERFGNATENMFGPERGLGAFIGGLPEAEGLDDPDIVNPLAIPRSALGPGVNTALSGLETGGEYAIRRPLSSALTAGNLAYSKEYLESQGKDHSLMNQFGALADPRTWSDAWEISEEQSPGQSFALMFGTQDVMDEQQVEQFVATDAFRTISGLTDAAVRLGLEPDLLLGKIVKGYRTGVQMRQGYRPGAIVERAAPQVGGRHERFRDSDLLRPINDRIDRAIEQLPEPLRQAAVSPRVFESQDVSRLERLERTRRGLGQESSQFARRMRAARGRDIGAYLNDSPRWRRLNEMIDSFPEDTLGRAGMIRDRLFPTHHRGDVISEALANARSKADRDNVMRIFLGDHRAIRDLQESDYALGRHLEDLQMARATVQAEETVMLVPPESVDPPPGYMDMAETSRQEINTTRQARIDEEIERVAPIVRRNKDLMRAEKSLPTPPKIGPGTRARDAIKSTTLWQDSPWSKPVRTFTDMRPHHIVRAEDTQSDAQLGRMMEEAGFGEDEIARARGELFKTPPAQRASVLEGWVSGAEARVMRDAGLDQDEIDMVTRHAKSKRDEAMGLIRSTKYDGEGRARVYINDEGEFVDLPLWVTQLQDTVLIPDFRRIRHEAERYGRLKHGRHAATRRERARAAGTRMTRPTHDVKRNGQEGLRGLMDSWKVGVLLRPAWPMRVVADEQMRMIAKFGALSTLLGAREGMHNYAVALKQNPIVRRVLRGDTIQRTGWHGGVVGAAAGTAMGGPLGTALGGGVGMALTRKMAQAKVRGFRNLEIGGMTVGGPFGPGGGKDEVYRALVSAGDAAEDTFGQLENRLFQGLRRNPNQWRTYTWGDSPQTNDTYRTEWARQVRRQIAQDDMGRQFLRGRSVEEVAEWLRETPEGQRYASLVPHRRDLDGWAYAAKAQVEAYTGGRPETRQAILGMDTNNPQGWKKLLDQIPEDQRAPIHGQELAQTFGRGGITNAVREFVTNSFEALGTMPTDALSRNPTFSMFYGSEIRRLAGDAIPGKVHHRQLEQWEHQARDFALAETRDLLYDMAERSQFSEMVRNFIPFFPAWQEVITRWAGLVAEKPKIFPRAREIWRAPEKAGWVQTDPNTGEEHVQFRLPSWAAPLANVGMFHSALDSQGYISFNRDGFNLAAEGVPGAGPIVQIAVSEMVERNPRLEESVKFILPFGPTDMSAFIPPSVRRVYEAHATDGGAARAYTEGRIVQTKLTEMERGERPEVDFGDKLEVERFLDEVDKETDQFMNLRAFTGFVSPVAPRFESPYMPYIEIHRALQDGDYTRVNEVAEEYGIPIDQGAVPQAPTGDPFAADDIFLEAFGEEFFAFTQNFTETLNGVPPTVEGLESGEEYSDLVTRYPEWGGVIAGYDGGEAAKWARAVYDRQLDRGERRRLEIDEIAKGPDIRLGWQKYSRQMDAIEEARVSMGLPNLQVAEAEQLRAIKNEAIARIASEHPAWFQEFSVQDRLAMQRRIEGARALAANQSLVGRPDIRGLRDYLGLRDSFGQVLATRENTTLEAAANQDLRGLWDTLVGELLEQNPEFADVYYRKLERDLPEAGSIEGMEVA